MKALVFSMLAIASMVACTSESDPINEVDNEKPVEIKMTAGILDIQTKTSGVVDGLKKEITDVVFVKQEGGEAAITDWTKATEKDKFTASISTEGAVTFPTKPYYPTDGAKFAHMVGYHPATKSTLQDGTITYTIDGNNDIMYASEIKGTKAINQGETKTLKASFNHKLAQLKIKYYGDVAAVAAWGTITSIKVKEASTNLILDLLNGNLTAAESSPTGIELQHDGSYPAISTAELAPSDGGYALVLPKNSAYNLTITAGAVTRDVKINIPAGTGESTRPIDNTLAGEAYTVTLQFKASEIGATAEVGEWTNVSGGTGTVD